MAAQRSNRNLLMRVLLAALVSQAVVTHVMGRRNLEGFGEQKNYYPPDPHRHAGSHKKPSCPTPSTPSHGGGGSYVPPDPSHGGGGNYGTPTPSHGGGGYYSPPGGVSPPTPVVEPGTPTTPTTPFVPPTPYTPGIPTPPSPLIPDPNNVPPFFTGTCEYWRTHPQVIWGLFGYWGTVGGLLGGVGRPASNLSLLDALRNPRTDGIGALYREATAAFLNSMVNRRFVFSTQQVRDAFTAALATEQAAANQAQIFQSANESHLKH